MGSMNVEFTNMSEVIAKLNGLKEDSDKVVRATIRDIGSRAPAWVGQEVSAVYGIKKAEIKASGTKESAGSVKVSGTTVDNITLVYKGRVLTPTHFKMKPKAPTSRKAEVSAEIFKGQRKVLGSNVFLGQSGSGDTPYIPFKRVGASRLPIESVKTLSIPQMIDNEKVNAAIYKRIGEEGIKRLNHQMDRYFKK